MKESRPLALVTGASSGIGAELAVELAAKGHDLLLTGRDAARLEEVAVRVRAAGAAAETKTFDLASSIDGVVAWVENRPLDVLVNNAGFGDRAVLAEADPAVLSSMINLNITSLTLLTHALLPGMIARGRGRILNVASVGSFVPTPTMSVYSATKAYVLSFTVALSNELKGTGVTTTALCPGATVTGFQARAKLGADQAFLRNAMTAEAVARQGVASMLRGKLVRVNGGGNAASMFLTRFLPRGVVAQMARNVMDRR